MTARPTSWDAGGAAPAAGPTVITRGPGDAAPGAISIAGSVVDVGLFAGFLTNNDARLTSATGDGSEEVWVFNKAGTGAEHANVGHYAANNIEPWAFQMGFDFVGDYSIKVRMKHGADYFNGQAGVGVWSWPAGGQDKRYMSSCGDSVTDKHKAYGAVESTKFQDLDSVAGLTETNFHWVELARVGAKIYNGYSLDNITWVYTMDGVKRDLVGNGIIGVLAGMHTVLASMSMTFTDVILSYFPDPAP